MPKLLQIFSTPIYEYIGNINDIFLVNKEIEDRLPNILSTDKFENPSGWNDGVITNIKHRFNTIEDYKLYNLKRFIEQHLNKYIAITEAYCPVPLHLTHSWINFTGFGQGQNWHQHDDSVVSGVYYFSSNEVDGDIMFKTPNPFVNIEFFPVGNTVKKQYTVAPKKGKLLLFPGWLEHRVEVNQSNHERISISFNFHRDNLFKNELK